MAAKKRLIERVRVEPSALANRVTEEWRVLDRDVLEVAGRVIDLALVNQVLWLPAIQLLLVDYKRFADSMVSDALVMRGEPARQVWELVCSHPEFLPGVNGQRRVRPCTGLVDVAAVARSKTKTLTQEVVIDAGLD